MTISDPTIDLDFFSEEWIVQPTILNFPCEFLYLWDQLGVCRFSALRYKTPEKDWKTWTSCRMLLEYAFDFKGYGTSISDPDWLGPWTDFVQILGNELEKEQNNWGMISEEKMKLGFFENNCEKQIHEYIFYREYCTPDRTTTCALKCNCVNGHVDVYEHSASNPFAPGTLLGQFIPDYTMEEIKDQRCDEANVERFFCEFYPLIKDYFEDQVIIFGHKKCVLGLEALQ